MSQRMKEKSDADKGREELIKELDALRDHNSRLKEIIRRYEKVAGKNDVYQSMCDLEAGKESVELHRGELQEKREIDSRREETEVQNEEIHNKENFLRDLFVSLQDGISVLDADLNIVSVNPIMKKWYGEGIIGKKCYEVYHGRHAPCESCPSIRAMREKTTQNEVVRDKRAWVEIYAYPYVNDAGEVTGVIEQVRDITRLRRAEVNEERLQALVDHTPSLVFLKDESGRYVYLNSAYEKQYAISRGWYGKTDFDFWPRESAELFRANDEEVIKSRRTCQYIEDSTDLQGNRHSWLVNKFPYTDSQGNRYIGGIGTDIIDRVRAEEALRESEARVVEVAEAERRLLYDVLENLPAMVCLITPDYHTPFANRAFREKFGEAKGRRCYEYCYGKADGPCEFCESLTPLETGKPHHWEAIAQDGSVIDVYDYPFTDVDGSPMILEMDIDITRFRRAEKELKAAKAQAELYLDLMGHDINNMHQIALGYLELAQSVPPGVQQYEMIGKSIEVLQRSTQLIRNVRKLQKLNDDVYQMHEVDVGGVLHAVQREFGAVPGKNVTLSLNCEGHCFVRANELLHDVFANLVSNAIKHTGDRADIDIDLDIIDDSGGKYCRVSVEDNGPGITDGFKVRIFNRMLKGTNYGKGMGLGLYLVKSLVESYDGSVRVEDRVKGDHTKGARFVVTLPAVD